METVREAAAEGVEARRGEAFGQIAWLEDSDMAARALEILVAKAEIEMLAGRRGNRDGDAGAGRGDSREFTRSAPGNRGRAP